MPPSPWPTSAVPNDLLERHGSAAQEAGESRMIGGIHFGDANLDGITLGTSVGSNAWSKAQMYFSGIAS
jgi:hypothetical protein